MDEHLRQLRDNVANAPSAPADMTPYLTKVRQHAYKVTDADVDGLKNAGFSEDEIFEQTVATAIAEGLRRFDKAAEVIG